MSLKEGSVSLTFYNLEDVGLNKLDLKNTLESYKFSERYLKHNEENVGVVEFSNNSKTDFSETQIGRYLMFSIRRDVKKIPYSDIKKLTDAIKKERFEEGVSIPKRVRREIQAEVVESIEGNYVPKTKIIDVAVDIQNKTVIVGEKESSVEVVLDLLLRILKITPNDINGGLIHNSFLNKENVVSENLCFGDNALFENTDDDSDKSKTKFSKTNLNSEEVAQTIMKGKKLTSVQIIYGTDSENITLDAVDVETYTSLRSIKIGKVKVLEERLALLVTLKDDISNFLGESNVE